MVGNWNDRVVQNRHRRIFFVVVPGNNPLHDLPELPHI